MLLGGCRCPHRGVGQGMLPGGVGDRRQVGVKVKGGCGLPARIRTTYHPHQPPVGVRP